MMIRHWVGALVGLAMLVGLALPAAAEGNGTVQVVSRPDWQNGTCLANTGTNLFALRHGHVCLYPGHNANKVRWTTAPGFTVSYIIVVFDYGTDGLSYPIAPSGTATFANPPPAPGKTSNPVRYVEMIFHKTGT